ncbi:TetR family transcriptional regulator [Tsukamurella hominis]|uniref:TetR family transcriptional regulator n=1 Tax=Tsukamurella hominis TaxID=1970232 RepID=UPI0039E89B6B
MADRFSADSTRDRILAAAADEFAAHGVSGARIDRIARRARSSKERVYAHFRSKTALYHAVAEVELGQMAEAVELDVDDLPGYAGRVHDYFTANPSHLRLLQWGRMESSAAGAEADPFRDAVRRIVSDGVDELREAQRRGRVDPAWDPLDVMVLVHQLALAWVGQGDLADVVHDDRVAAGDRRRKAVVAAVGQLFPAAVAGTAGGTRPA